MVVDVLNEQPNVFEFTIGEPPKERFPFDPQRDFNHEKWQWNLQKIKQEGKQAMPTREFFSALATMQILGGKYDVGINPKAYQKKASRPIKEFEQLSFPYVNEYLLEVCVCIAYVYPELRKGMLDKADRFVDRYYSPWGDWSTTNIDDIAFKFLMPARFEEEQNSHLRWAYEKFIKAVASEDVTTILSTAARIRILDEKVFKEKDILGRLTAAIDNRWGQIIPPSYISWPGYLSRIFDLAILSANNINWDGDKVSLDFDREDCAKNAANLPEVRSF